MCQRLQYQVYHRINQSLKSKIILYEKTMPADLLIYEKESDEHKRVREGTGQILFKSNQVMQSNRIINITVFDNCFYISDVADIL